MPLHLRASSPASEDPTPFSFNLSPPLVNDTLPSHTDRSPPSYRLQKELMTILGGRPGEELEAEELGRGILKCRTCGKPVLEVAVGQHLENCQAANRLEAQLAVKRIPGSTSKNKGIKRRNSDVSISASEASINSTLTPSKRMKSSSKPFARSHSSTSLLFDGETGERQMLENGKLETKKQMVKRLGIEKKEARAVEKERKERGEEEVLGGKKKVSKGPKEFHPDKCCGVLITEGAMAGSQCSRKLDCKIHTVGNKREVLGRSMPFDDCLRNMKVEQGISVPEKKVKQKTSTEELGSIPGTPTKTPAKKGKKRLAAVGAINGHQGHKQHQGEIGEFVDSQAATAEFEFLIRSVQRKTCRNDELVRSRLLEIDIFDSGNGGVGGGYTPPAHSTSGTRGLFGVWHLERKRLANVTEGLLSDIVHNVGADLERRVRMGRQSLGGQQGR